MTHLISVLPFCIIYYGLYLFCWDKYMTCIVIWPYIYTRLIVYMTVVLSLLYFLVRGVIIIVENRRYRNSKLTAESFLFDLAFPIAFDISKSLHNILYTVSFRNRLIGVQHITKSSLISPIVIPMREWTDIKYYS
jgi:hypothetical protein